MAAVSALASMIKLRGSMIMQIQGDGPIHTLVAQANNAGEIRGLAHGHERIDQEEMFSDLVGQGRLVMTVDGEGSQRYQGVVNIEGDELAEVLAVYFKRSEQLLTHIHLVADGKRAACFLLQQLPDQSSAISGDSWQHIKTLGATLKDQELLKLEVPDILHRLYHEESVRVFDSESLVFRCRCSREKIEPVILQMGLDEAMALVNEQGEIRADCEFCNRDHRFDRVDVANLFEAKRSAPVNEQ